MVVMASACCGLGTDPTTCRQQQAAAEGGLERQAVPKARRQRQVKQRSQAQQGFQRQVGPVTVAVLGAEPGPQPSGEPCSPPQFMLMMPLLWQGSAGCPIGCVGESQCDGRH